MITKIYDIVNNHINKTSHMTSTDARYLKFKTLKSTKESVIHAQLKKFRLMRTTSSHMVNYSHWNPNDPNSRMGLKHNGILSDSDNAKFGSAEYIVGGWCIGTVLDSAASRTSLTSSLKKTPQSMTMNINTNVEWWSSDMMYRKYMNRSGLMKKRGARKNVEEVISPQEDILRYRDHSVSNDETELTEEEDKILKNFREFLQNFIENNEETQKVMQYFEKNTSQGLPPPAVASSLSSFASKRPKK